MKLYWRLREQFTPAALILSIVALIAALAGGAIAANPGSDSGKATDSAVKKGPRGPKGPAGPSGPPGAQGLPGATGEDGTNGTDGTEGRVGDSVVITEEPPFVGDCGDEGGAGFTVGGGPKVTACNGADGETGEDGSDGQPWTPGNQLPSGAALTGRWAVTTSQAGVNPSVPPFNLPAHVEAVSFPIQLAAAPTPHFSSEPTFADFDGGGPGTEGCTGTAAAPSAPSGHLCVYIGLADADAPLEFVNPHTVGAELLFLFDESGNILTNGSWAVTG